MSATAWYPKNMGNLKPETYAMMATGLAVLGFVGRRRKQKVGAAA